MARSMTAGEFEELYRSTAPELLGYLRRRHAVSAEDLAAEVFVIAWRRRADLPQAFLRRAWLFGTARKLLMAEARRHGREREAVELVAVIGQPTMADTDGSPEGAVAAALGRLTAQDRELICLVEWENLTPAEIAVALGIRPGTARVRLHRARQSLAADPELLAHVQQRRRPPMVTSRHAASAISQEGQS